MNCIKTIAVASVAALLANAPAVAQVVFIDNARVITAGPAGTLASGDILIRNGIIEAVGAELAAPEGASVIDAAGRVVTPGFIAPYSALGLEEISLDDEANDAGPERGFPLSASLDAVDAYNPTVSSIAVNRAGGITRALTAPDPGGKLFAGKAAVIDLSGRIGSVTKAEAAQVAVLGYGGAARAGDTRMGAWALMRQTLDAAKAYAADPSGYAARPRDTRFELADLEALGPVVSGAQPLIVAIDGAADIRNLIRLKTEYGVKPIILGGAEAWRAAREIAAAGIPVIVDPISNLPGQFEDMGATLANPARLHAAGVEIAFFSPAYTPTHNLRLLPQMGGNAVANGLPYEAAIAALTIGPARMFGLEARLGSLEPGKAGDVVLWDGDPLEVTARPVAIFIDGRAMSMENRQTRLRDRYRDLSRGTLPHAYRGDE